MKISNMNQTAVIPSDKVNPTEEPKKDKDQKTSFKQLVLEHEVDKLNDVIMSSIHFVLRSEQGKWYIDVINRNGDVIRSMQPEEINDVKDQLEKLTGNIIDYFA